jgi:hypothetical protein
MNLSNKQIEGFVEAWKADFGETLTKEMAHSEANRLLEFFLTMHEDLMRRKRNTSSQKKSGGHGDLGDIKAVWKQTIQRRREIRRAR